MAKLRAFQKDILAALRELGGEATARQIAVKMHASVNGVVQSLNNALDPRGYAFYVGEYLGGDTVWKLVDPPPD